MTISVCERVHLHVCAYVNFFSFDLANYSVASKFHCHYVWITALCYLSPNSAFWSTLCF